MGITERNVFAHQIIGQVSCIGKTAFCCLQHSVFAHSHGTQHWCQYQQTFLPCFHRIKQGFFVLLHIFVIGQWQPFHGGQKTHQMTIYPTGFTPHQLCHIRIFLLRHNAAAGAVSIIQINKMKFLAGPNNNFFAHPAQMHRTNRSSRHIFQNEISVTNPVHRV